MNQTNDYSPFGMLMPGRTFSAGGGYRWGFQGEEVDEEWSDEGNSVHFTFREYDPRIGRMRSPDPLLSKFPYWSPYAFSGNRLLDAIELEGLEPYFGNKADAERVANDANAIYYSQYGDEESKNAIQVKEAIVQIENPDYGFLDKIGVDSDPQYIEEKRYYLSPSEDFNWDKDKYTQAMKDVLDAENPVLVKIVEDERREGDTFDMWQDDQFVTYPTPNDEKWKMIWERGGGKAEFPLVVLSKPLLDTKIGETPSSSEFTIGGVFMHEFLYHLHYIGQTEDGNPDKMRQFYSIGQSNQALGKHHPAGQQYYKMYGKQKFEEIKKRLSGN